MLSQNELEAIGKMKGLNNLQTEKDYLQNILLYIIYSKVGKELIFKGGTCLYKLYRLNRFSEDLDFSISKYINVEKLLERLIYGMKQFGASGRVKTFDDYHNQFNINLEFKGPFYKGDLKSMCFIDLDISTRERPLLSAEKQTLYSSYGDMPNFDVFAMNLTEILAEKIGAIYNRKKPRDVYDAWFLLRVKNVGINKEFLSKKLKGYRLSFKVKSFLEKIEEKRRSWETDIKPLVHGELPDFSKVKSEIEEKISELE